MTVALLILATHKYKQFVQSVLNDVKKHFLPNHKIEVHLFTDDINIYYCADERVSIHRELINSWRFPQISLYRYKIFTSKKYPNCDYLFYMDVDMSIVDTVGDEIFGNIVAVSHPGFHSSNTGAWCDNVESNAYTFKENRKHYYAGGFQGGRTDCYYRAMRRLSLEIQDDEKRDSIPEWHDEGYWNRYLSELNTFTTLSPSYCMVEQRELREAWAIEKYEPKIIALAKDHKSIRE